MDSQTGAPANDDGDDDGDDDDDDDGEDGCVDDDYRAVLRV